MWRQIWSPPIKEFLLMGILVFFLLLEISVLLIWLHYPYRGLPLARQYGCFQPPWFKMSWFLHNRVLLELDKINLHLILKLTLCLIPHLFLPPLLPLRLVKVLVLVTRWLRRRRKGRRRRRSKFSRGATKQPLLWMQHLMRNHPSTLTKFDIHANFVRETIFFETVLIFLRS